MRKAVYGGMLTDIVWAPITICQNRPKIIKNALQSYPSGHTGTAFTVMIFMSLYLNAKLKAFADFNTSFCKILLVMAPVIAAVFVSGTLLIDGVSPIQTFGAARSLSSFSCSIAPFDCFCVKKKLISHTFTTFVVLELFQPALPFSAYPTW